MTHHQSSIRELFLVLLLLAAAPAYPGTETPAATRRMPAAVSSPLTPEVERELAAAPADVGSLATIYRRTVRSDQDAASFFYSGAFLRLGLGGQRQVIDTALALDPAGFVSRSEFLPVSLRAEYRRKAGGALDLARIAVGVAQ